MTAEESAIKKFQDEPFFEVLLESVARQAVKFTYAKIKHGKTLGVGDTVDRIIRDAVLKQIEKLEKVDSLNRQEKH